MSRAKKADKAKNASQEATERYLPMSIEMDQRETIKLADDVLMQTLIMIKLPPNVEVVVTDEGVRTAIIKFMHPSKEDEFAKDLSVTYDLTHMAQVLLVQSLHLVQHLENVEMVKQAMGLTHLALRTWLWEAHWSLADLLCEMPRLALSSAIAQARAVADKKSPEYFPREIPENMLLPTEIKASVFDDRIAIAQNAFSLDPWFKDEAGVHEALEPRERTLGMFYDRMYYPAWKTAGRVYKQFGKEVSGWRNMAQEAVRPIVLPDDLLGWFEGRVPSIVIDGIEGPDERYEPTPSGIAYEHAARICGIPNDQYPTGTLRGKAAESRKWVSQHANSEEWHAEFSLWIQYALERITPEEMLEFDWSPESPSIPMC